MKNTTLFLLIILLGGLVALPTLAQTIRRCNNNPGVAGVNMYTTIQAAHDAAAPGDVIYVEPSGISYGGLTCTKRLTIVGNGYFLTQNSGTSVNKSPSSVDNIACNAGSAGTIISGLKFGGPTSSLVQGQIQVLDANITVTRCWLGGVSIGHSGVTVIPNNFTISRCIIGGTVNYGYGPGSGYTLANGALITNNIFNCGVGTAVSGMWNATISNNTIYSAVQSAGSRSIPAVILDVANTTIFNNIFDFRNAAPTRSVVGISESGNPLLYINNTISNNICLDKSGLPVDNGNINNVGATTTFQTANPWLFDVFGRGIFEQDAILQLAPLSPARGIGMGGTDAGAFGGVAPYILSGQPNVPIITNFTTSGAGNNTTPLTVTISVRSNN